MDERERQPAAGAGARRPVAAAGNARTMAFTR
jgi:hypothetical protein